jgi:hypothetical protein
LAVGRPYARRSAAGVAAKASTCPTPSINLVPLPTSLLVLPPSVSQLSKSVYWPPASGLQRLAPCPDSHFTSFPNVRQLCLPRPLLSPRTVSQPFNRSPLYSLFRRVASLARPWPSRPLSSPTLTTSLLQPASQLSSSFSDLFARCESPPFFPCRQICLVLTTTTLVQLKFRSCRLAVDPLASQCSPSGYPESNQ